MKTSIQESEIPPCIHSFCDDMFRQRDTSVLIKSNNITKIPSRIHTVTRPAPAQLLVFKRIKYHILRNDDVLVFGVFVADGEFAKSNAFKLRKGDLEVPTDFTDVFRAREVAMSAISTFSLRLDFESPQFPARERRNYLHRITIASYGLSVGDKIPNTSPHFLELLHIWKHWISVS